MPIQIGPGISIGGNIKIDDPPAPPQPVMILITESGDTLITESGDVLTTE